MDIMDLLAQARPDTLNPGHGTDRRASDLARAIATPRDGITARPGASRRPGVRLATPRARALTLGIGAAAVAAAAGAVVAVSATGTPAPHTPSAAPRTGTAATTPGQLRNAILTAFNGVAGDVFYAKITETYSGKAAKWNGVSQSWAYPLQPQAGQKAYVHYLVVPSVGSKGDSELIWTEPSPNSNQPRPTKTTVIDVDYGNRTWSVTSSQVSVQSEAGEVQSLRTSILNGDLKVVRTTKIDGRTVLELTDKNASKKNAQTWWVDPVTYLPVRSLNVSSAVKIQVDYGFLKPTPANIAKEKVTIPPGFTQTPTIR
ncbi:MAG TPA: hypothetical protein VHZ33_17205 [Trebonia sp.]|nr:hypothetical protein [Trebonia sp.]